MSLSLDQPHVWVFSTFLANAKDAPHFKAGWTAGDKTSYPSSHFHLDFYPLLSFYFPSPSTFFHHVKREGKPSWPFLKLSFPPLLFFCPSGPKRASQTTPCTYTHTQPDTCTHRDPLHPRLFSRAHTLSFSVPYTSNTWKDALRGPRLKGELVVRRRGRSAEAGLRGRCIGDRRGPRGEKRKGSSGAYLRPGQCQGGLAGTIHVSLFRGIHIQQSRLLSNSDSLLSSSTR